MKTIEETRRELFEARMLATFAAEGYTGHSLVSLMERGSIGQYYSNRVAGAWEGFNAALDAVVIELPSIECAGPSYDSYLAMNADDVRDAIKATNLGLKIK